MIHHFYDQMCPTCAEFNFKKRTELADLRGRVALLTGGRVKIGYQAGLKLLRSECAVGGDHSLSPRCGAPLRTGDGILQSGGIVFRSWDSDLRYLRGVEELCHHLLKTTSPAGFSS